MKVFCKKHEYFYEKKEGCLYCEEKPNPCKTLEEDYDSFYDDLPWWFKTGQTFNSD